MDGRRIIFPEGLGRYTLLGNTETWVDPLSSSSGKLGSALVTWLFIGTLEFSKVIIDEDASFVAPFSLKRFDLSIV